MDTTSTGMPPISPAHDALDKMSHSGKSPPAVQSLIGEGKAQVSTTLNGVSEAVRDVAEKLEGNGAGPLAKYIHDAADTVSGWSHAVESKSVDDLVGDARSLVRTSPGLAISLSVGIGFVAARLLRSDRV